ncbi:Crp/Fnr family transcriptional regulator, partial [Sphingomonas sp. PB4P5]|uniref:Crp/Fnr family transcriptional regulator n=1 Tax=Parasphingomonas puruogangriensis TaxID=3096155 RepID=UPI002FC8C121
MIDHHLAKLRARAPISAGDERQIRDAISGCHDIPADRTVIRPNVELTHSTLLLDGWLCRYKDVRSGERQITELHLPGDFVDLHSFTLKHLDHAVMSLTPARIATVPHDNLRRLTEHNPHLARVYWFATNLDAAIHREWEVSLGRRSARAKLATLFCELLLRLQVVGMADETSYDLPLTQTDLGDCTGLTSVHVNRTLKDLRGAGLVTFRDNRVTIHDLPGLRRAGEFDPTYLYLD